MSLTIIFPQQTPGIFRTKKYGDPFMVEAMGLDTTFLGTTNFQNIDLFHPDPGAGFGGVSKFQKLGPAQMDYLKAIQPTDAGSFAGKMNFLCGNRDLTGRPERPYWTEGGDWKGAWTAFKFGTIVFGGQLIQVETDVSKNPVIYTFTAKYQQRNTVESIEFYKLVGMRWSERNAVSHKTHPWKIQKATWADWDNGYRDTWQSGTVHHPVWAWEDFPANYPGPLYIARAFLEPG